MKIHFLKDGATLYVQAEIQDGYVNTNDYRLFFDRNDDYGINDETEQVAINWDSPDTVNNTKWLSGGPDDTGVSHTLGSVPGCAVGNVIEFAVDLNQLGSPSSLTMSFRAKNGAADSTHTVVVKL